MQPTRDWSQDVFGNLVAVAEFGAHASELTVTSELAIETSAEAWPVFPIAPRAQSYPFEYAAEEATDLGALRSPAGGSPDVAPWAKRFVLSRPTDTLALLKDLSSGILANTTYRRREEEGVQTAAETLAIGSGSCRDLAGLFIEAARTLGFGARAVSGYLVDPQSLGASENTTHAWAEAYLPGAAWIAFDPTNATVGNGRLTPGLSRALQCSDVPSLWQLRRRSERYDRPRGRCANPCHLELRGATVTREALRKISVRRPCRS